MITMDVLHISVTYKKKAWRQQKPCNIWRNFQHPHTSISPCTRLTLWCLQLSDTALINWKMTTSCALQFMFHNLRKLTHTFSICLPSWEKRQQQQQCRVQTRLSVPASFRSRRMAPTLLCLETTSERVRRGEVLCVWRGVCWRSPTKQRSSSHLLCPSLPAFFSVPDWSTTPEPTTTSSLPPHTHTHTAQLHWLEIN